MAAGTRAVQMLKQVLTTLKMTPLFEAVNIPFVQQFLDENRKLQPNEVMTEAAAAMLDELARVEAALRPLREPEAPEPAEPETEDLDPEPSARALGSLIHAPDRNPHPQGSPARTRPPARVRRSRTRSAR